MALITSTIASIHQVSTAARTTTDIPTAALTIVCGVLIMVVTTRLVPRMSGVGLTDYLRRRRYCAPDDNISLQQGSQTSFSGSDKSDEGIDSSDDDDDECMLVEQRRERDSFRDSSHHLILKNSNGNKVVARILPKNDVEYESHKPNAQRSKNTEVLRISLEKNLEHGQDGSLDKLFDSKLANKSMTKKPALYSQWNDEDLLAAVHVDATVPSSQANTPEARFRFHMNMHRRSNEPARKTLRRLSLSLQRKIQSEERKLDPAWKNRKNPDKHYFYELALGRDVKDERESSASATVWVRNDTDCDREPSLLLDSDDDSDLDGYTRYHIARGQTIAQLWDKLHEFQSSKLCIHFGEDDAVSNIVLPIVPCPPTIIAVRNFESFTSKVYVGVPLVVEVDVQHATHAVVVWFVDGMPVSLDTPAYTPSSSDVGKKISVLVIPARLGQVAIYNEEAYEFANQVEPLPTMPLVSPLRDSWIATRNRGGLRVMTYNILADMYTARDCDSIAMYSHCETQYLCKKRRMPMILYELLAFHPDIVCLQEVDADIYNNLFRPVMESQGFQGYYSNKASAQLEGCAMFWSLKRFQPAGPALTRKFYLKDLFQEQTSQLLDCKWESLQDINQILDDNSELRRITEEKVGQVLQIAELYFMAPEAGQPDRVLIGNTHLFYHPLADHVRLMQAYIISRQMEIERHRNGIPCPFIICGDFNSSPLSGAVQLMLQKQVGPENHDVWKNLHSYEWGMGDEEFLMDHGYIGNSIDSGVPLYEEEAFEDALESFDDIEDSKAGEVRQICLPPTFPNLVSGYSDCPEFTNYSVDFLETLDYIFVSIPSPNDAFGLLPVRSAPLPTASEMKPFVAMPNEYMPSDHVSLLCDLEWGRYDQHHCRVTKLHQS